MNVDDNIAWAFGGVVFVALFMLVVLVPFKSVTEHECRELGYREATLTLKLERLCLIRIDRIERQILLKDARTIGDPREYARQN